MSRTVDFNDLRYLNEVGWFLYREQNGYNHWTDSYTEERRVWSRMLRDEVLGVCEQDNSWLQDKCVMSMGCGCSGDLSEWDCTAKFAVDPLLITYQRLGMLVEDLPGTVATTYISVGAESVPLLDCRVDLIICRNSLDHMLEPHRGLAEIQRLLKPGGLFFLGVDLGGEPTPDEPSPYSSEDLRRDLDHYFIIQKESTGHKPYNQDRLQSVRVLAQSNLQTAPLLDKNTLLSAYMKSIAEQRRSEVGAEAPQESRSSRGSEFESTQ